jgi:hypothetical protein
VFAPDVSHIYMAVVAGLSEIGYNGISLTPEYGPQKPLRYGHHERRDRGGSAHSSRDGLRQLHVVPSALPHRRLEQGGQTATRS